PAHRGEKRQAVHKRLVCNRPQLCAVLKPERAVRRDPQAPEAFMTQDLLRALLLMGQKRWAMAEAELHRALAEDGQNAEAHRLLATCLLEREQLNSAEAEARMAVHLAPDAAATHLTLAWVLYTRRRDGESRQAVEEAIRLDADQADAFGLLAWICFRA